jgi:hypothetical protein
MGLYGRIRGYEEEGEGESTRSALMRSDDGGENWEYFSTLAYDAASIIDYEASFEIRVGSGRLLGRLSLTREARPSLCSIEETIPPSRPALHWARRGSAVRDGRRPPRSGAKRP